MNNKHMKSTLTSIWNCPFYTVHTFCMKSLSVWERRGYIFIFSLSQRRLYIYVSSLFHNLAYTLTLFLFLSIEVVLAYSASVIQIFCSIENLLELKTRLMVQGPSITFYRKWRNILFTWIPIQILHQSNHPMNLHHCLPTYPLIHLIPPWFLVKHRAFLCLHLILTDHQIHLHHPRQKATHHQCHHQYYHHSHLCIRQSTQQNCLLSYHQMHQVTFHLPYILPRQLLQFARTTMTSNFGRIQRNRRNVFLVARLKRTRILKNTALEEKK